MKFTPAEKRINELFDELVPASGKADTVAGEIIRAVRRLGYRNYNDGDHIGVGYGNETCNAAARYLADVCEESVALMISRAWGIEDDQKYDLALGKVEEAVVDYLYDHPELEYAENTTDMFEYREPDDADWFDDEDDDESFGHEY